MKNLITIATVVFLLLFVAGCDKETIISEQDVPIEIKNFVSTNFTNCSISKAIEEKAGKEEKYEITLSCGCKLEFNKHKEIIDIDCASKLPDSVIPANMLAYVNSNYSNNYIIGWEIQSGSQEVQLNDNTVLVFDLSGQFIRVDN